MKTNSLRNLWNSITRTLSRSNTRRRSNLSRGGREAASQHAKVPKTPELTACETSLSALSDLTSDPREEDWPTDDSFVLEPDFSDHMSDNASDKYQTKAVARTIVDIGGSADETGSQAHSSKWLQELPSAVNPLAQTTPEHGPTPTEQTTRKWK